MSVVVVNCSTWPTFASSVRTRALDLYPLSEGVEFWDTRSPQHASDPRIWGDWPRCFGDPLWVLRDELWDLVASHASKVFDAAHGTEIDPLAIVVVLDAARPSLGRRHTGRTATVMNAMHSIAERIASESTRDIAALRRSMWRVAVLLSADRIGSRPRVDDEITAQAWELVVPRQRPVSVDQNPASVESLATFDTAILVDAGTQRGVDDSNFAAVRILIDILRDPRARTVLKPAAPRSEQRLLRLSVPRIRYNPSDRILADLAMLTENYDSSPVRDPADDPLKKLIDDVQNRIMLADERRLSEVVKFRDAAERVPDYDPEVEEVLRRYFKGERPRLAGLADQTDVIQADAALVAARDKLEPFLNDRHHNLQEMRKAQDESMRFYKRIREDVESAATDRSFGHSGRVLAAIENGLARLFPMQNEFIKLAERRRRQLNEEYQLQLEAARSEDRDSAKLSDFAEVDRFDVAKRSFIGTLANSTTLLRFRIAWVVFSGLYALLIAVVLMLGGHGSLWTPATAATAALALVPALFTAILLFFGWRWLQKRLSQARTQVEDAYGAAVDRIDKVTRLALAHLASSRIAGRVEPFTRVLTHRGHDLRELRDTTERIFAVIESHRGRLAKGVKANNAATQQLSEQELMTTDTQDSLKIVLSKAKPPDVNDVEMMFSEGEVSNSIAVKTALVIDPPLSITFMPLIRPEKRPPDATPPPPPPPKSRAPSAPQGGADAAGGQPPAAPPERARAGQRRSSVASGEPGDAPREATGPTVADSISDRKWKRGKRSGH
jgi:hypothetical protein